MTFEEVNRERRRRGKRELTRAEYSSRSSRGVGSTSMIAEDYDSSSDYSAPTYASQSWSSSDSYSSSSDSCSSSSSSDSGSSGSGGGCD